MVKLSTDLSEQQIKQLNDLRAKKANADRARLEYNKAFQMDCIEQHLTKDWYEICMALEIDDSTNMQRLKEYLQGDKFKDFAHRKIFTYGESEQQEEQQNNIF
jgi:hypothetical protein